MISDSVICLNKYYRQPNHLLLDGKNAVLFLITLPNLLHQAKHA